MAGDFIGLKVTGLDELARALREMPAKLRARALRNALAAGGRVVRDEARRNAPLIGAAHPSVRSGRRKVGTMRRAISVRTSKVARRQGDVGVFINVRPAKGAQRGARNAADPYYWRFVEFGTSRGVGARRFLQAAAGRLGDALRKFTEVLGPEIAKLNNKAS